MLCCFLSASINGAVAVLFVIDVALDVLEDVAGVVDVLSLMSVSMYWRM